jgi:hypothetical protein
MFLISPFLKQAFTFRLGEVKQEAAQLATSLIDQIQRGQAPVFSDLRAVSGYTTDIEENLDLLFDHVEQSRKHPARAISCVEVGGVQVPVASHHLLRTDSWKSSMTASADVPRALQGVKRNLGTFLAQRMASDVFFQAGGVTGASCRTCWKSKCIPTPKAAEFRTLRRISSTTSTSQPPPARCAAEFSQDGTSSW